MCGILGQIEPTDAVDQSAFQRMLDTLAMRGPDGSGIEWLEDGRVALGHRRLSIIDLSDAGRQPMTNEDRTLWLTFNGEIYNFRTLRKQLEGLGHTFASGSDSEVILHGFEAWGDDVVHHLEGIFAFGLWDQTRKRLLLARDHYGVKPLYYWQSQGRMVFASQPRAIVGCPGFRPEIDHVALAHYLAYGYIAFDKSIYAGMNKLPSGHRAVVENGRISVERYHQTTYKPTVSDPAEAVERVRTAVEEAVKAQTVSDVPLGVFLSGGIDSSAVAAIVSGNLEGPIPSYTIGYDDPRFDERRFAKLAADRIGCGYDEQLILTETVADAVPLFAELYDEPFYDYSGIFVHFLSKHARASGVPVILAGDGGDEVFAGYGRYDRPLAGPPRSIAQRLRRRLGLGVVSDPLQTYFHRACMMRGDSRGSLLAKASPFDEVGFLGRFFPRDVPVVTGLQLIDLQAYMIDDILTKVDHASMACGVEVRVPLLDRSVVDTAFSIRHDVLMPGGERKGLFKQALAPHVPAEILTSRKKGFGGPIAQWMSGRLGQVALELIRRGALVERGLIQPTACDFLSAVGNPTWWWQVLALELWTRRWLESQSSQDIAAAVANVPHDAPAALAASN